jgi:uncharacterized protein (DUF433 family)
LPVVEWDEWGLPTRLYPYYPGCDFTRPVVAIDPRVAFGRPVILRPGITTRAIKERVGSGESPIEVAADYDLSGEEVHQALLFERAG